MEFGLWYPRNDTFSFKSYSNVNWAGCMGDRKSTSDCALFLGNYLVSWLSKKQAFVSLSTTEVECIAVGECCT